MQCETPIVSCSVLEDTEASVWVRQQSGDTHHPLCALICGVAWWLKFS